MSTPTQIGLEARIAELWRYPVKSMLGEVCASLEFEERGVVGDRLYAVRDSEGHFGSGKDTRRFRRMDCLLDFQARIEGELPRVTFPDGRVFEGDSPELPTVLSDVLGQDVTLARERDVSHLDAGAVHFVTTASLRWLGAQLGTAAPDVRRFRPNLLLDLVGATPVEQAWIGRELSIGSEVRIVVTESAERCRMVGMAQTGCEPDSAVLTCLGRSSNLMFGVYADVLVPGRVHRGDRVQVFG